MCWPSRVTFTLAKNSVISSPAWSFWEETSWKPYFKLFNVISLIAKNTSTCTTNTTQPKAPRVRPSILALILMRKTLRHISGMQAGYLEPSDSVHNKQLYDSLCLLKFITDSMLRGADFTLARSSQPAPTSSPNISKEQSDQICMQWGWKIPRALEQPQQKVVSVWKCPAAPQEYEGDEDSTRPRPAGTAAAPQTRLRCSAFASDCPKDWRQSHAPFPFTFAGCLEESPAPLERDKRIFLCQAFSSAIHLQQQAGKHSRGLRAPQRLRERWITPSQPVLVQITHTNKTNESVLHWQRWALCTVALGYEIKLITLL